MPIRKAEQPLFTKKVRDLMATHSADDLKKQAHDQYSAIGQYMAVTQDFVGQMTGRYSEQYKRYEEMEFWIKQGDQATEAAAQKRNYAVAIVLGRPIQRRSEAQHEEGGLGPSLEHAVDEVEKLTQRDPKPGDSWPAWQVAAATAGVGALLGVGVWLGVKASK